MRELFPSLNLLLQAEDEIIAELLMADGVFTASLALVDHLAGVQIGGRLHGRSKVGIGERTTSEHLVPIYVKVAPFDGFTFFHASK